MTTHRTPLWRRERLGLTMIASSLIAIVVTGALLLQHLHGAHDERIQALGRSLVRLLAAVPADELARADAPAGVLQAVRITENPNDFAYANFTGVDGSTLAEVASDGVDVPRYVTLPEPAAWFSRSQVPAGTNRAPIYEFHAPVLRAGELAGHIRVGYFVPNWRDTLAELPFFATLALIVFLLMPLSWLSVRRELRPLRQVSAELDQLAREQCSRPLPLTPAGELAPLISVLNRFIGAVNERVEGLESEHERALTSTRLLSYRKERILRVLESLPDGIIVMDEAGTIGIANRHIEAVFGVAADAVTGSASLDWCTHDHVREFLVHCRGAKAGRYLSDPIEFQSETAPDKTYLASAFPLFGADTAQTVGCLVTVRDVTAEVLARNGRAEFVAHVSHELKTPLSVMSMYSEALQSADLGDENMRVEAANVIQGEVSRLSAMINNLLSITKIEMGSLDLNAQRVRMRDLIEDVFNNAKHLRDAADLSFELQIPNDLPTLKLDKDLLRVALNNLLTNAIKYNRPGGSVTVSAEELAETVRVRVADTGIGIAEQDIGNVFEKFYRSATDEVRERSGHGLGLSLTRDIVAMHDGSIQVNSVPGEGTEFVIDLWKNTPTMQQVV